MKLFTQYSKLVEEAFENDSRFLTSRDKVHVIFHNATQCTVHAYVILFQAFREIVNETSIFKLELSSSIGKAG